MTLTFHQATIVVTSSLSLVPQAKCSNNWHCWRVGRRTLPFGRAKDASAAANGDVFIADGHSPDGNNRVAKYSSRSIPSSWGETGYAPGEFRALHAIAIDPDGRVFVGDRSNSRIQIFDQEGNHSKKKKKWPLGLKWEFASGNTKPDG